MTSDVMLSAAMTFGLMTLMHKETHSNSHNVLLNVTILTIMASGVMLSVIRLSVAMTFVLTTLLHNDTQSKSQHVVVNVKMTSVIMLDVVMPNVAVP
jgi:hypothetical protein